MSVENVETFLDSCAAGKAKPEEIDDWIDYWHESDKDLGQLHDYLGMTLQEYSLWAHSPGIIHVFIESRKARNRKVNNAETS